MSEDNRLLSVPNVDRKAIQQNSYRSDYRYNNPYGVEAFSEKNYLREYVNIILKRKWVILSIVIIVTFASAMYWYRIPSIYESHTTLLIEKSPVARLKTKDLVINMVDDPTYWQTQLRLLQNPELMRDVVLKLNLHNNTAFYGEQSGPGVFSTVKRIVGLKPKDAQKESAVPIVNDAANVGVVTDLNKLSPEQREKVDRCADMILGGLSIDPIEGTKLVTLHYQHTKPAIAAAVVHGVADVFIESNYKRERGGQKELKEEVAKNAVELRQKIERLEEDRLNYLKSHNVPISTDKGANIQSERLQTVSEQLLEAENLLKVLRTSYSTAVGATNIFSVPEVQSDKNIQEAQKRISELNEKRSQLLIKYTDQHPEILAVNEQLKRVDEYLKKSAEEVVASLKSRYESTQKRRDELAVDYQRELSKSNQDSQDMTRLGTLNQEIETTKQLYNQVLQRQQEMQLGQDSEKAPNNVTIATAAKIPDSPIGPNRSRNIFIAFFVSLFAGVGLAFLLDFVDDTLKSMDDVSRYIQLPTLAMIPHSREEKKFLRAKNQPTDGNATALVTMSDARSPMAEAYRHLRTSLLFSSAGRPPKTILITSGQPMEGKTTTAINTSISLAQTGAETIIVDCDLRRPRVHTYFGLDNEKGLTNYLSGERDLTGLIQTFDKLPNLKLLSCGPISPNPAELLGSEEMRGLLETLKENFSHVIVDTPPILSFTDAAILATQVDGVLIVAMGGRSSRALVRRVKLRLMDVGAKIFGVVLNGMKKSNSADYEYGYNAGYYSRYYAEDAVTVSKDE